jgi:hypothetical protein
VQPVAGLTSADTTGRPRAEDHLAHARFRARGRPGGIGAATAFSSFRDDRHLWYCIVTDRREWHYVSVVGPDADPYPNLSAEDIEQALERFAETLPARYRIRHLLNASPLHVDRHGNARD